MTRSIREILAHSPFFLALVFVGLTSIQAVNNADVWFHLKIGEYIVKNHTFPQEDLMSHTAMGREWIVHSWGYGVLSYLIQSNFGLQSLVFLRLAIGVLLFLTLWKTCRLYKANSILTGVTIAFSFYTISIAWIDRPHLLGSLFTATLMLIIALLRKGKDRYSYLIPPLLVLWANTHASLPLATAIMLLLLGSNILEDLVRKKHFRRSNLSYKLLTKIIPISVLVSCLNPYHLKIYKYFFKINSIVTENIFEWLPLSEFFADPYVRAFLIFIALYIFSLVLTAILEPREISYFELSLFLILSYLAFSALRHMVVFTLIMSPFLAKNLTNVFERLKSSRRGLVKISAWIEIPLLLGLTAALIPPGREVSAGRWGLPNTLLPVEAVGFIEKVKPKGRMYNHFNWGGYLLWRLYPEYQTFIDGRLDMFVPDIYKEWLTVALGKEDWEKVLQKYQVSWIIFPSEGIWESLREKIENEQDWCLVFWDDFATILVRGEENKEICQGYGYKAITPFNPQAPAPELKAQEAEREYVRAISSSEKNASAHNKLGTLYYLLGKNDAARQEFESAKETNPRYASPYYNLGCIEEKNNPGRAVELFETTTKLNPQFAPAYKKLGLIYGRRFGNIDKAKKYLIKYEKAVTDPQEKNWAAEEIYRLENGIHLLDTI